MCGTPISTPAPLLCCLRLPLPIHLCQLWCPVLHRALSRHPPGDQVSLERPPGSHPLPPTPHNFPGSLLILGFLCLQMPKVDCVSLGSLERKALCASPWPWRGHHQKEKCSPGPREELFTGPRKLSVTRRDVGQPSGCCREEATARLVTWCFGVRAMGHSCLLLTALCLLSCHSPFPLSARLGP